MADESPEQGDSVTWSWGANAPGGVVAEKKTDGEAQVTSHRGNVIRKSGTADDPALAISRPGNNVVKKASEVEVQEKGTGKTPKKGGAKKDSKADASRTPKEPKSTSSSSAALKRARDAADDAEAPPAKRGPGRPKGSSVTPKPRKERPEGSRTSGRDTAPPQRLQDEPQPEKGPARGRGRPRGTVVKATSAEAPKKRGRPAKTAATTAAGKRRGRPPGSKNVKTGAASPKKVAAPSVTASGRKRGRPPGSKGKPTASQTTGGVDGVQRGRGRPKKNA